MSTYIMPLSYDKPPLSLNDRGHWAKTDQHRKALRAWSKVAARKIGIPTGLAHITTRLHYRVPDRRRRDEDNLIATAKPLWDGLVDAGIVPDDTSDYMTKLMPRIHPPSSEGPALWLTIETQETR